LLMRIECCPSRSPTSASRRLPGGDLKSPSSLVELPQFPGRHLDQVGPKDARNEPVPSFRRGALDL
jgi:hypothetical protein